MERMTGHQEQQCEAELEAIRQAASEQIVPLLKASVTEEALNAKLIKDSPAGLIIFKVLLRDADAATNQGTIHLAAGVVMVTSLMVRALAAQTGAGDPQALAGALARQFRDASPVGRHIAYILDHLLEDDLGIEIVAKLLGEDQEALADLILKLAELAAVQATALAHTGGTDMDALWEQIDDAMRA
jgi:butyrate kinase